MAIEIFKEITDSKVLSASIVAIITWIVKSQYDKIIKIHPRLYLTSGTVLYKQINRDNAYFNFTWDLDITVKNNSQYTAEQLSFIVLKDYEFSDKIEKLLPKNNHLEKYNELALNTTMKKQIPYEELANIVYEGEQRIIYPGLKHNEPQELYKPNGLKHIRLIVKYKNEKGKSFYTYYTKVKGKEKNKLFMFNPLLLGKFLILIYK